MRPIHLIQPGSLFRRCATVIIALALLATGFGLVVAVDDADTGDISVNIVPSSNTPPPSTAEPGGNPQGGLPAQADQEQPQFVARPGTVTAYITANDASGTLLPSWLTMVVRDDRGTAAGWVVVMSSASGRSGWAPTLMENRSNTVSIILPPTNVRAALASGIVTGQALGPLWEPLPILRAAPGNGAGVYLQLLGIAWPPASDDVRATIYVHIPFAP